MKPDEYRLLKAFQQCHVVGMSSRLTLRELAQSFGMNHKRAAYIAQKWADKGWYNYGVNISLGWLEPAGLAACPTPVPFNALADITDDQMRIILNQRSRHAELLLSLITGITDVDQTQTSQSRSERAEVATADDQSNRSTSQS